MRSLRDHFEDVIAILTGDDLTADRMLVESTILERDDQIGRLTFCVAYQDGSRLSVQLWADCSGNPIHWLHYSFYYQDERSIERFRYGNAPHHKHLPNYPHHLHERQEILPQGPPTIHQLVRKIRSYMTR